METRAARFQHQKHVRGGGQRSLRLLSSLCLFLHREEDKRHDLLFWHLHQEDSAGAVGSTSKSFVRRSSDHIC